MNELFRSWTRGTTFTLTMGRAQVAVLVALAATPPECSTHIGWNHRRLSHWVTGVNGLQDRGLLIYRDPKVLEKKLKRCPRYTEVFELTPAGQLVVGLLKESGVYNELANEFVASDKREGRLSHVNFHGA